ncbi:D-tyrosyl-tRNA deacylase [Microstroma glucosiphilum]|uniref:D-aminoacyl-tRNA deacylase n=1 Tax=Pseudomicrostroma glucosiphilum TaxID=1684307 RepID=A0A316UFN7_9BASI|nr:D-tyrosyl-tRNA deacylase [Pseudomicrostroma glucosiphilum]PWN24072.1 D-tyrosyl-tRNA deacylase [Pseudomicrostroma glucosiphilum]
MKAVLQRVKGACVHVDGKLVSSIGPGIVALIGIGTDDTMDEVVPLANKILSLKLWNEGQKAPHIVTPSHYPPSTGSAAGPAASMDPAVAEAPAGDTAATSRKEEVWGGKPWKASVVELGGEILCVSQFTLHARTAKGTKPDFHKSMGGSSALPIYQALLSRLGQVYDANRIKDGAFGEMMDVTLTNDGPVTLIVDTRDSRSG